MNDRRRHHAQGEMGYWPVPMGRKSRHAGSARAGPGVQNGLGEQLGQKDLSGLGGPLADTRHPTWRGVGAECLGLGHRGQHPD